MWVMGREQQEGSVGETQGGEAPSPPLGASCVHWSEPLLLSSGVELGVEVQHPVWQVLQYSLKEGVGLAPRGT